MANEAFQRDRNKTRVAATGGKADEKREPRFFRP
jgi:hypothetical protein